LQTNCIKQSAAGFGCQSPSISKKALECFAGLLERSYEQDFYMATLLLVDDDEDLAETLRDLFELLEHQVDIEQSGTPALERLASQTYDLILLDWQLPDMTGIDVCKQYRASGGQTPILMLTGMRDRASREEGKDAGADSYLAKPFTMEQLKDRVESLLDEHGRNP
jgi:DNA-binding response OmpR family regulator